MTLLPSGPDPRLYQIAVLSSLLAWGIFGLDLEVRPAVGAATVAAALAVQWLGTRLVRLQGVPLRFDPRSALISSLSLTLLLRTASPALGALAAALAIGSKFAIRVPGPRGDRHGTKHVFNPANFGIVAMLLLTDRAWISPGQWGSAALLAFAVASLGFLVVRRAERSDVTWAFLLFYGGLLFGRALWLGDPLAIPRHQLANGALLVFAFFMISDPKTTPDSRPGRVLYALLVAAGAGVIQFAFYEPAAPIWALAALAPTVPLIDRLLPGGRYRWPGREPGPAAARPEPRPPSTLRPLTERTAP
jgi:Na+-transporting NADH:ubiquinone oxidoreductase subunit NqrB